MRHRVGLLTVLLVVALVGTGCLDVFFAKPVKVSGIVTIDGEAPGDVVVQVEVVGSKEKATVSGDGAFEFELKPGKYALRASGEGLKTASVNIVVQKNKPLSGVAIDVEPVEPEKFYLAMDFSNDEHLALLEKPWPSINYEIKNDPFGDLAWFFPPGSEDQKPPVGFKDMRFVLVNTPIMENFRISVDQLGSGGDEMVVRAHANGDPITIDGCRFPAADYTPGKIGFGGHSYSSVQSWYFRNVIIEEL